ncbi:hypothetical protein D7Z94_00940 [Ulvibacterium marinum]|uniref:Uncharacterized protein n=1 Tax=Ulvibacterium marinum TaxID=2419782 RepID=A0A3B0CCQ1_9FLAO|nr:hypothetical protein D7Z94_00940 [Ulvibacterium marinum]
MYSYFIGISFLHVSSFRCPPWIFSRFLTECPGNTLSMKPRLWTLALTVFEIKNIGTSRK